MGGRGKEDKNKGDETWKYRGLGRGSSERKGLKKGVHQATRRGGPKGKAR